MKWAKRPRCCWTTYSASWNARRRNALLQSAKGVQTFLTCTDKADAAGAHADAFLTASACDDEGHASLKEG